MSRFFHKSEEGWQLKFGLNYYGNFFTGINKGHSWIVLLFFIPYGISIFPHFYQDPFYDNIFYGRKWNVLKIYIRRRSDYSAKKCGKRWIFGIAIGESEIENRKLHRTRKQAMEAI